VAVAVAPAAGLKAPAMANGPATTTYSQALSGKLTVAGSTALEPLIDQAANPDVQITVSAGGSGAGRSGVCQGSLDIGLSDVPLTDQEISDLDCANAVQTAVAIEAFAVATNPRGPGNVHALPREQMQALFTGQVTNWAQIGGDNQPVVLVNRLTGSGTRQ
jgi:phosphate transport system substrate-binding protein